MNRYAYVENAPLAFGDPSGLANVHMPSGIYTGGGLTDAALEAQLQAQAQLAQFALDEFAVLEGYFAGWGHYVTQMQQVGACNPDVPCDTKPVQVWVWNANAFDQLPFLVASNNQPQAPSKPQPKQPPPQKQGNSWSHPLTPPTCHQWTLWAASDAGISYVSSGGGKYWNPVSAVFGGAAVIEGIVAANVCQ